MRKPIPPPPASLEAIPLHVLVREYPETLAILLRHGIDPARRGAEPASSLAEEVRWQLRSGLEWRVEKGSGNP